MSENKELIKNTLILGIGQLVPSLVGILLIPLLTVNLSATEYGLYDLVIMLITLILPILTMQIQQGSFRFLLSSKSKQEQGIYIFTSYIYVLFVTAIFLPIVYSMLSIYFESRFASIMISFQIFSQALFLLQGQIARGLNKNIVYSMGIAIYGVSNMSIIFLLRALDKICYENVIGSMAVSYFIAAMCSIVCTKTYRYFKIRNFSFACLKSLLKFSAPIVPSSISFWVVNLSDRLIITSFLGLYSNGIYSVANKIPSIYVSAYNIFNLAWTETAVKVYDKNNSEDYYSKLFNQLFKLLLGGLAILIGLNFLIFKILVKGEYGDAYVLVPVLYIGVFLNSLVSFLGGVYIALAKTKNLGISSVAGAIINVLLNLLLVNKIGLMAAAISTLVSYLVILIFRIINLHKLIKIKYDFRGMIFGFIFVVIISLISNLNNMHACIVATILAGIYNLLFNKQTICLILNRKKRGQ